MVKRMVQRVKRWRLNQLIIIQKLRLHILLHILLNFLTLLRFARFFIFNLIVEGYSTWAFVYHNFLPLLIVYRLGNLLILDNLALFLRNCNFPERFYLFFTLLYLLFLLFELRDGVEGDVFVSHGTVFWGGFY